MTSSASPAIVIAAHSRPAELRRLCRSVVNAEVAQGTTLIISIDGGAASQSEVRAVADQVEWPHGPLTIVEHEHLGLVEHFHRCGDLAESHGSIILLEDDLVVGPAFHRWATAALDHGARDDRIAGVSLAAPFFDGYRHLPFEPLLDGFDSIYAQVPWYDGMAWTADMWRRYRSAEIDPDTPIHALLLTLADDEWFPDMIRYLLNSERYFLLPRHAHATNSGAAGAHFDHATDYFQVPLTLRGPASWNLAPLDEALAVYDDHLEFVPEIVVRLCPDLIADDLVVDLRGIRDLTTTTATHALTTRQVTRATASWGASLHPLIANVVFDHEGDAIRLAKVVDVKTDEASDAASLATLHRHASRGRTPSRRDAVRQIVGPLSGKFRRAR